LGKRSFTEIDWEVDFIRGVVLLQSETGFGFGSACFLVKFELRASFVGGWMNPSAEITCSWGRKIFNIPIHLNCRYLRILHNRVCGGNKFWCALSLDTVPVHFFFITWSFYFYFGLTY